MALRKGLAIEHNAEANMRLYRSHVCEVKQDPKKVQYCKNFLLRNSCSNKNCARSHKCPRILNSNGYICNGNHLPAYCPGKGKPRGRKGGP